MRHYHPARICVEHRVTDSPITRTVLKRLPDVPVEFIDSYESKLEEARTWSPTLTRAKRWLILARHRGRFFKPCPAGQAKGAGRNACCNYFIINFASNCHMECSYCYLQSYLNFPYLVVYANVRELLEELEQALSENRSQFFRIGTGELADSLALDGITGYGRHLVEFFAGQPNAVLEFKTKTACVHDLLELEHRGHTVVSWSLNPRVIQETEEHKTATIDERFRAAVDCVHAGYRVAFHLDPLIHYPGWEQDYKGLVREIYDRIPVSSLAWISLGALRMSRVLQQQIRSRFPSSSLPLGELVPCPDGKLRYFKPIRVEMYRQISGWIRLCGPRTPLYMCMERKDIWQKALGTAFPGEKQVGDGLVQMMVSPPETSRSSA